MKQSLFIMAMLWYQHSYSQRVVSVSKTTEVQVIMDSLIVITHDMAVRDLLKKSIPASRVRETEYNPYDDTWTSWLHVPKGYAKFALELIHLPIKLSI